VTEYIATPARAGLQPCVASVTDLRMEEVTVMVMVTVTLVGLLQRNLSE
jgi:hypothetical protein